MQGKEPARVQRMGWEERERIITIIIQGNTGRDAVQGQARVYSTVILEGS